ncbi:MAG: DUF3078 domain-containing protein [Bacteroidales bacterium]|jgi:hypothetical protein|nr:DUF3078 domain-containing protein [Bacteroidales bacterium]
MRKFIIIFSAVLFSIQVFSQELVEKSKDFQKQFDEVSQGISVEKDTTYWLNEGDFSIQFNQVSFSNWAAGGINSYATVIGLNYSFNYTKAKSSWDNKLVLSYGMQSLDGEIRKTDDKIDYASKYGHKLSDKTYFGVLFSVKSQFTNGYNYPDIDNYVSRFAAPMYIGIGPGIDYKPSKFFSLFLAPATAQWVIVSDVALAEAYGNEPDQKVRAQFGTAVKMQFIKEIAKNIKLDTKLELFSDYLNKPQNIIVNWDMAIDMKVNKLISAKLTTGLIYDDNIIINDADGNPLGPRIQLKEMFGAGLSVKL